MVVENLFTLNCTHCRHLITRIQVVCDACSSPLVAIKKLNAFEIFGIKPSTTLDPKTLKRLFLDAQKQIHPDRFIREPKTFTFATEVTALLNKSFAVLSCPLQRSLAFIAAHNHCADINNATLDPAILDHLLEKRAQIDTAENTSFVQDILTEISTELKKSLARVASHIEHQLPKKSLEEAAFISYLLRVQKDAKKKLPRTHF
ncbi:MAG: hypothetical protein OXC30_05860 [Alphaproteobacteria bacterium]|nr:hypothetical protein [Alphaproteobacteria bacterium]